MDDFLPYMIVFFIGLLLISLVVTGLTVYGWKRRQGFNVDPRFSLFTPMVKVSWSRRRFGDWLTFLKYLAAGILSGLGFLSLEQEAAIAFIAGVLAGTVMPHLGNVVIGIIDRYEIQPATVKRTTHGKSQVKPITQPHSKPGTRTCTKPQSTTTTETQSHISKPKPASKPKGWRSEDPT